MPRLCLLIAIQPLLGGASIAAAQTSRSTVDYTNRAMARYAHGDLDGAIKDFGIAIAGLFEMGAGANDSG
jgi:hypothetical protein